MALVDQIADSLQLPPRVILAIRKRARYAYKHYTIAKRDGGRRDIYHPSRQLKVLQRWLARHVVSQWPVHARAMAYQKGRGIKDNAIVHRDSRFLLRIDLHDFFPSISRVDVQKFLDAQPQGTEEWDDADRSFFVDVVCHKSGLTIGAPSSPSLSNAMCFQLDQRLEGLATDLEVAYSRYADDLFFSTVVAWMLQELPMSVQAILNDLRVPGNLTINEEKTRHSSKKGRRQVTGLVLSSDGRVCLGRQRKRYIRRQIHRLQDLDPEERAELSGLLAFAMDIEPDILNALILKYGAEKMRAARYGEVLDE